MLGEAIYSSTEKLYLRSDRANRDDKWDSVRQSGSCSLRLVELGSGEDPDPEVTQVEISRSVVKEGKPHKCYTTGCDVDINCVEDSEVTRG